VSEKRTPKIVIKSHEKRLVFAEVYSPLQVDVDEEAMTPDEVEKMAHNFLLKGRTANVDVMHSFKKSGCRIVESFLARKNDPDGFIDGAWVVAVKVIPDKLWEQVKKGELNCFSFGGKAMGTKRVVEVDEVSRLFGDTEKSADNGPLPEHTHPLQIDFQNGKIIQTETGETLEHIHKVNKISATEMELDHAHRIIAIEN